jgi:cytochrome c
MERNMFETMTPIKGLAAVCGTFCVFLVAIFSAEKIYHVGPSGHVREGKASYVIATGIDGASGEVDAIEVIDFDAFVAAADSASGEKIFARKCTACHKVDGSNTTGPHLDGVFGRDIGSVDDYGYSDILTQIAGGWTAAALSAFLEKPKTFAPETKMAFTGLKDIEERADIVAYLQSIGG